MFTVYYRDMFGSSGEGRFTTYKDAVAYIESAYPDMQEVGEGVYSWESAAYGDDDSDQVYISEDA